MDWDGNIVTEYLTQHHPLIQRGIEIHEGVHRDQLVPYSNRGWIGALEARIDYFVNQDAWELPAYRAQARYLDSIAPTGLQGLEQALSFERSRVNNNIRILEYRLSK